MSSVRFTDLEPDLGELISEWFDDPDTVRFLDGHDWLRGAVRFEPHHHAVSVTGAESLARHSWLAIIGDQPVAVVVVVVFDDSTAAIEIAVAPTRRRIGIGKRVLGALWDLPELDRIEALYGYLEPAHSSGRRLAAAAGFEEIGSTSDGKVLFRRARPVRTTTIR